MKPLIFAFLLTSFSFPVFSQHTFSIVAVDSATGEIGSAGATCLDATVFAGGALVISDLLPGRAGIHTQASYLPANQQNARFQMLAGKSPQEAIDWLKANDAGGNNSIRQYGIVDFDSAGSPRAQGFTGANCFDEKSHITGPSYSIQGNILLNLGVLDSMEARFLRRQGSLAERLMAALQGANIPGADSRCLAEGVSSQSAFLRVAKPGDPINNVSLHLVVDQTPFGGEPIDSLQILFDEIFPTTPLSETQDPLVHLAIFPNPFTHELSFECQLVNRSVPWELEIYTTEGKSLIRSSTSEERILLDRKLFPSPGLYWYRIKAGDRPVATGPVFAQ